MYRAARFLPHKQMLHGSPIEVDCSSTARFPALCCTADSNIDRGLSTRLRLSSHFSFARAAHTEPVVDRLLDKLEYSQLQSHSAPERTKPRRYFGLPGRLR